MVEAAFGKVFVLLALCLVARCATHEFPEDMFGDEGSASPTEASPADVLDGGGSASTEEDIVIHLLNVLPYPSDGEGWDRAYELIPAAEIAQELINNSTDVLPGYRLEIINVESEHCGVRVITEGLVNTYQSLLNESLTVVGTVGLFCSSVTEVIAPLVARYPFDYVTVAGSTSIAHRNVTKYPRLHHALSSAGQFGTAVIELMRSFGWEKINVVHDSSAFFVSSANYFIEQIEDNHFTLVTDVAFTHGELSPVVPLLEKDKAKIVDYHGLGFDAACFMCQEYKSNRTWPDYVHIFHDRVLADFLDSNLSSCPSRKNTEADICTPGEMKEAIDGIFMLRNQLFRDPNQQLVSGWTFEEYHTEYLRRLDEIENTVNNKYTIHRDNVFAGNAHDAVWAIALALNNSLGFGVRLENYKYRDNQSQISDIVQRELLKLGFEGVAGFINFNEFQETSSPIDIHQVINGADIVVGTYATNLNGSTLTFVPSFNAQNITNDCFEKIPRLPNVPVVALITALTIFCYCFTTFNLLLLVVYRKDPSIKALSPYLSLLVFIGCYLIFTTILFKCTLNGFSKFAVVCNLEVWCMFNGLNLIFATMFLRLLRLRHIFKSYGQTGRLWSDKYLFLGILLICGVGDLLLVLWMAKDKLWRMDSLEYIESANPPYYEVTSSCFSDFYPIWLGVNFGYSMLLLTLAVFMAVMTRHIKLSNFKDTKKINAYAFACVGILSLGVPLSLILKTNSIGEQLAISLSFLLVGLLCQAFIFASRTFPLLFCKKKEKLKRIQRRKESQYALTAGTNSNSSSSDTCAMNNSYRYSSFFRSISVGDKEK